jgi:hypothetical protein
MNDNDNQSNESVKTTRKQIPAYPRNGDCHLRIPAYEWDILTMVCSIRACGINEAITWIIRTHISRVKDPALISDMLTNIGANIDDIVIYMEDIQATADELTTITMKGIQ